MLLCSGPFCTSPGSHSVDAEPGRAPYEPVKSSFAVSLNSTRIVRSLASCVPFACLSAFGLLPVSIAFASSLASSRAATGLPWRELAVERIGLLDRGIRARAAAACVHRP